MASQTLDKLSRAPAVWFKDKLPTGAGDGSAQLRPLLDDFLKSEWVFEMRDAPASPEYALAIRLDDNRAGLWQTNLCNLLESWTKITAQNIPGGWELKKDLPPNLFRFIRAGNWVVIGCGQNELPLSDEWAHGTIPQSGTNWLNANVDWPRLAQHFPVLAKFDFPAIKMQAVENGGNLQLTGTFDLSQPLPSLEKWQPPSDIIYQPLTGFTAARGFAPWLQRQSWAGLFALSPEPNQFFSWSLAASPLQTFFAVPVPNATNALAQLGQNLHSNTSLWQPHLMAPFALNETSNRLWLHGVPFIAPEVDALSGASGNFLFGQFFPNLPHGKAAPPELFQAFDRNDMVFYHWEMTSMRIKDLPQLTQLSLLLTQHKQLDAKSAADQWLALMGPKLGPSITEAVQTGPSELSFIRNASAGLTAFELIVLANWLEAPNFPGCDLHLPPQQIIPTVPASRPVKVLTAPAPPPPAHH